MKENKKFNINERVPPIEENMQATTEDDVKLDTLEYWKQCAQDAISANQQLTKDYYDLQQKHKRANRDIQYYKDKAERAERGVIVDNTPTLSDIITGAKRGNYVLDLHIRISSKDTNNTKYGLTWGDDDE